MLTVLDAEEQAKVQMLRAEGMTLDAAVLAVLLARIAQRLLEISSTLYDRG